MANSCLSLRTLKNYLRGGSSSVDVETIESHIASCKSCQHMLEELADSHELDVPWLADIQLERAQVVAHLAGSQAFRRNGEQLVKQSSGLGSETNENMETIRDYKIIESIGQGGMGTVYRALHLRLNRLVALKILKSDRLGSFEANSRFTREMRLLAQLEHPQIVRALDAGEFEGQQYFVMEFVPGVDLGQFIRRIGPIPVAEACEVIRQASGALHYAHDRKILHRDVKPSNLMITADGKIKLLDLGLAQLLDKGESSVTETDQAVGTFAYMAPETLFGNGTASPQSDVYSLGVTLFQMLSGMRPFERPGAPVLVPDLMSIRPDVSPELNSLVYKMISIEPAERPRSMQDVERLFQAFANDADLPSLVAEYYRWGNRSGQPTHSRQLGLVPPPVQSGHVFPHRQAPTSWPTRIAVASVTALLAFIVGLGTYDWRIRAEPSDIAEAAPEVGDPANDFVEPILPTMGTVKPQPHGDVASQLLTEGRICLVSDETNERFTLGPSELQVPLGKYTLEFDSPVQLEEEGQPVEVFASTTNQLNLRATLTCTFQFPTLPSIPGTYASYYGTIWLEGWEKDASTAYELSLEILPGNDVEIGRTRWLKLVANLPKEDYSETAYLQIDEPRWLRERRIEIVEGFVQPHGRAVTRYRESLPEEWKRKSFVFPLEVEKDHIASIAELDLPEKRISVQDFLTLFFGANNVTAASELIRNLRQDLASPGSRNAWLADVDNGTGPVSCYMVSSRQKTDPLDAYGYSMARRDDELYGFVQLEVRMPQIVATCMLKNQSKQAWDDLLDHRIAVDKFRSAVINPEELPAKELRNNPEELQSWELPNHSSIASNYRFDLSVMPDEPSSVAWRGSIARGSRKEDLEVTASMLWQGEVDGQKSRWLELEVESTLEGRIHWEGARLLVDSEAYDSRQKFKVLQGWVAFDEPGNVYLFPPNGDLGTLVDDRLQRQSATQFDRIGIVDVLAMLFDADLQPKSTIGTLRARLAGILAGADRTCIVEKRKNTKLGFIECDVWRPPILSLVQYEFFRNADVPFGFVAVSLQVPLTVDIGLEAYYHGPIDSTDDSIFGSTKALSDAVIKNQKRIKANDLPNWRVWNWTHKAVDYKVWAEFAGEIDPGINAANPKFVVLANAANKTIRVPYSDLSPEDRAFVDQGHVFASTPKGAVQQKILQDNEQTGILTLSYRWRTNANRVTGYYQLASMVEEDRRWIYRLRSVKRNPQTLEQVVRNWEDFVSYTHP